MTRERIREQRGQPSSLCRTKAAARKTEPLQAAAHKTRNNDHRKKVGNGSQRKPARPEGCNWAANFTKTGPRNRNALDTRDAYFAPTFHDSACSGFMHPGNWKACMSQQTAGCIFQLPKKLLQTNRKPSFFQLRKSHCRMPPATMTLSY